MLYLLEKTDGGVHYLSDNRSYVIGRKGTGFVINDMSISRKHAVVTTDGGKITVVDCGSKYGTFYKDRKIEANRPIELKSGDVIRFGVLHSSYRIKVVNLTTACTSINNLQKSKIKRALQSIGGVLLPEWSPKCEFLTVNQITVTLKVLHALVDNKPVVTLKFWEKYADCVKNKLPPPDFNEFKPPMAEAVFNRITLTPNAQRKSLFHGKTFVFSTDKVKGKMEDIVLKTGGTSISFESQPIQVSDIKNDLANYIFVSDDASDLLKSIHGELRLFGLRPVTLYEFAVAVTICSCEKQCNPAYKLVDEVFANVESSLGTQLVAESQYDPSTVDPNLDIIIPQTLECDLENIRPISSENDGDEEQSSCGSTNINSTIGSTIKEEIDSDNSIADKNVVKRKTLDSNTEYMVNPFKRIKTETPCSSGEQETTQNNKKNINSSNNNNNNKRKAEESLSPPSKKPANIINNPFAGSRIMAKEKVINDNPFKDPIVKTEPSCSATNSFPCRNNNNLENEENVNERSNDNVIVENVAKRTSNRNNATNLIITINKGVWLSKKKTIKKEDGQLNDVLNKFQKGFIIKIVPTESLIRRNAANGDSICDGTLTCKNFKIFKKVLPLKPQVRILETRPYEKPSL